MQPKLHRVSILDGVMNLIVIKSHVINTGQPKKTSSCLPPKIKKLVVSEWATANACQMCTHLCIIFVAMRDAITSYTIQSFKRTFVFVKYLSNSMRLTHLRTQCEYKNATTFFLYAKIASNSRHIWPSCHTAYPFGSMKKDWVCTIGSKGEKLAHARVGMLFEHSDLLWVQNQIYFTRIRKQRKMRQFSVTRNFQNTFSV